MATAAKSAKGTTTRDQILDTAARLISLRGYHCTALDDVLRESGVGKGNFYYYFRSKEELGYAIIDRVFEGFIERTLEPTFADESGDPVAQIHAFLDRVLDHQRKSNCTGGCPMGNLASELSDVHEGFRQRLARVFGEWRSRLARALERGRNSGRISGDCEPATVAQFLVASLEGAILLTKVTKDISVMEDCVDQLKHHLMLYAKS
jgi:TetR/AcrR family transcriptional repressor of nem operon